MNTKFKNKSRTTSPRLKDWNYQNAGLYFITICTNNRSHFFGNINRNQMHLNQIGNIVKNRWFQVPHHSPTVILHNYTIMPNHLHGILEIGASSLPKEEDRFQNQGKNSLFSIVGSFKSSVTKESRILLPEFAWQTGFYDHVIKSEKSLYYIQNYIDSNVENWAKDELFDSA